MRRGYFLVGLLVAGCSGGNVIAPPPSQNFEKEADRPPPLPPSSIDAPLLVDMRRARELLETALARRLGDINKRITVPEKKRTAFAFELRRDPFQVSVKGDTFVVTSTIHYQGRGWYKPPIGPEISGSCGTSGDQPRARVVIQVRPKLTREWRLQARPRLAYVGPVTEEERDQCEVTFAHINVTGKVIEAARGVIESQLPKVGDMLARLDVRGEFEKIWLEVQKPIRLTDSVWLMLRPTGVRLGHLSGTRDMLGTTVGITSEPKIETGPQPMVAPLPLPPLDTAVAANGFSALIEGRFGYPVINKSLTDALAGTVIKTPGGTIKLKEVAAFGIGGGRLALGVRFGGTTTGLVYFIGTPKYDEESGEITVPDLDYDASSVGLLVRGLAWLKGDELRDFLRTKAVFPSGDALDKLAQLTTKGLNRDLAPGIHLSAAIDKTHVIRIVPRANALILQAHATGEAALHVTDEFFGNLMAKPDSNTKHPVPAPPPVPAAPPSR
ncbi:MAG: DUF4403 family protein [Gemmatimonadota bacterium]